MGKNFILFSTIFLSSHLFLTKGPKNFSDDPRYELLIALHPHAHEETKKKRIQDLLPYGITIKNICKIVHMEESCFLNAIASLNIASNTFYVDNTQTELDIDIIRSQGQPSFEKKFISFHDLSPPLLDPQFVNMKYNAFYNGYTHDEKKEIFLSFFKDLPEENLKKTKHYIEIFSDIFGLYNFDIIKWPYEGEIENFQGEYPSLVQDIQKEILDMETYCSNNENEFLTSYGIFNSLPILQYLFGQRKSWSIIEDKFFQGFKNKKNTSTKGALHVDEKTIQLNVIEFQIKKKLINIRKLINFHYSAQDKPKILNWTHRYKANLGDSFSLDFFHNSPLKEELCFKIPFFPFSTFDDTEKRFFQIMADMAYGNKSNENIVYFLSSDFLKNKLCNTLHLNSGFFKNFFHNTLWDFQKSFNNKCKEFVIFRLAIDKLLILNNWHRSIKKNFENFWTQIQQCSLDPDFQKTHTLNINELKIKCKNQESLTSDKNFQIQNMQNSTDKYLQNLWPLVENQESHGGYLLSWLQEVENTTKKCLYGKRYFQHSDKPEEYKKTLGSLSSFMQYMFYILEASYYQYFAPQDFDFQDNFSLEGPWSLFDPFRLFQNIEKKIFSSYSPNQDESGQYTAPHLPVNFTPSFPIMVHKNHDKQLLCKKFFNKFLFFFPVSEIAENHYDIAYKDISITTNSTKLLSDFFEDLEPENFMKNIHHSCGILFHKWNAIVQDGDTHCLSWETSLKLLLENFLKPLTTYLDKNKFILDFVDSKVKKSWSEEAAITAFILQAHLIFPDKHSFAPENIEENPPEAHLFMNFNDSRDIFAEFLARE